MWQHAGSPIQNARLCIVQLLLGLTFLFVVLQRTCNCTHHATKREEGLVLGYSALVRLLVQKERATRFSPLQTESGGQQHCVKSVVLVLVRVQQVASSSQTREEYRPGTSTGTSTKETRALRLHVVMFALYLLVPGTRQAQVRYFYGMKRTFSQTYCRLTCMCPVLDTYRSLLSEYSTALQSQIIPSRRRLVLFCRNLSFATFLWHACHICHIFVAVIATKMWQHK